VTVAVIFDEFGLMTVNGAGCLAGDVHRGGCDRDVKRVCSRAAQVNASGDAVALGIDRGHVARGEHGVMMPD
jgi:hypothetical protein